MKNIAVQAVVGVYGMGKWLEKGKNIAMIAITILKGITMTLTFKQQVALALLQNLEWMPKFDDTESVVEYLSADAPETTADIISIGQQIIAVMVAETAERIVEAVG